MDALRLAVTVCAKVESVNVRFDCSTHHDMLQPLTDVVKLKNFSLVCVSNGERSLLNFEDVLPILKYHGEKKLRSLELKVIFDFSLFCYFVFFFLSHRTENRKQWWSLIRILRRRERVEDKKIKKKMRLRQRLNLKKTLTRQEIKIKTRGRVKVRQFLIDYRCSYLKVIGILSRHHFFFCVSSK